MTLNNKDIFERMKNHEEIPFNDPQYYKIFEIVSRTMQLSVELNNSTDINQIKNKISEIIGEELDESTRVFIPFYTNFGKHIRIGKNVFINHDCTFLDMGGIKIEDDVLIGPKVSLLTEAHPIDPSERKKLIVKPIVIKKNAWIGAGAIIQPGVTVGENSVVAAGAVVTKDVDSNRVVAGVPAKVIKTLNK